MAEMTTEQKLALVQEISAVRRRLLGSDYIPAGERTLLRARLSELDQQKLAVMAGHWPLFRYNPLLAAQGKAPMTLDSKAPSISLDKYAYNETRYTMLIQSDEEAAERLLKLAQEDVKTRWKMYEQLAAMPVNGDKK